MYGSSWTQFLGKIFSDWEGVTKVYIPDTKTDEQRKIVSKYKREARKATFTITC